MPSFMCLKRKKKSYRFSYNSFFFYIHTVQTYGFSLLKVKALPALGISIHFVCCEGVSRYVGETNMSQPALFLPPHIFPAHRVCMLVTNNVSGFRLSPLLSKYRQSHSYTHWNTHLNTQKEYLITPNTDAFQKFRKHLCSAGIHAVFNFQLHDDVQYVFIDCILNYI